MKKIISTAIVASFLFSNQIPASAANKTLKAGNAVTISFPGIVKLKKSGCQNISVKYTVGRMPNLAFAFAGILDDSDNPVATETFYKTPSFSSDGKIWKKNGTFNFRVCREDWLEDIGDGESQEVNGARKGTYQIWVAVNDLFEGYGTITFK